MNNVIAYNFGGMHFFWWIVWGLMLIWIFASPYKIPGQRLKNDSPLEVLKMRLASGLITDSEFLEKKNLLEK